jgi:hypothetical protein
MAKKGRTWEVIFGLAAKHRRQIAVGEKIPLELNERERDLIMKYLRWQQPNGPFASRTQSRPTAVLSLYPG